MTDAAALKRLLIPNQVLTERQASFLQIADLGQLAVLLVLAVVERGPLARHVLVERAALGFVLLDFAVDAVEGGEEAFAEGVVGWGGGG